VPRTRTLALLVLLGWLFSAAFAVREAWGLLGPIVGAGIVFLAAVHGAGGAVQRPAARGSAPAFERQVRPDDRVTQFLGRVDRLPTDRLRLLAGAELDDEIGSPRRQALERALDAARLAGRGAAAERLRQAIEEAIERRFAQGGYDPTMFGIAWRSEPVMPRERVAIAAALADAAVALLVRDRIGDDTFAELAGPVADLIG